MVGRLAILAARKSAPPKQEPKPKQARAHRPAPAPVIAVQPLEPDPVTLPAITPQQIMGARGLLQWSQQQLGDAVGMQRFAINRIEQEKVEPRGKNLDRIEAVLVAAGIELIPAADGKGEGVRFARPKGQRPDKVEPPKAVKKAKGEAPDE